MDASESTLMRTLRWLLAALFLVTGALKAIDPVATAQSIANYQLLPAALVPLAALYVPWLEVGCGLALLTSRLRRGGWLLALLLSEAFLVFTVSALVRGLDISCGCFGTGQRGSLPWIALLDAVMIAISLRAVLGFARAPRDTAER
jgi:uncharacterized membrane protein YphA (DoxX/SURF4 family)